VLHDFTDVKGGSEPFAGLVRDSAGNLYGTTFSGGSSASQGSSGAGTVFKLDKTNKFSVLYSFSGKADGARPLHRWSWIRRATCTEPRLPEARRSATAV
jgi:uncharacterized repeat protein (TIGR03803 family)